MTQPILELQQLRAGYGRKQVVHGVDLALHEGDILLMLGHNGAGKTTLVRAVFGLLERIAHGSVLYRGKPITGRPPHQNVRDGIAFVPQGHGIFPTLTVRDNLVLGAYTEGDAARVRRQLAVVHELFPILAERSGQLAGTFSGGQQQMLAIGMALMHDPRVLILDEPSIGLAPAIVEQVMLSVQSVNRQFGTSILMVEQNVSCSLPVARRCVILKTGTKVYDGPPDPLQDRVELMKYF
ncbi:ABC transporter ATP-binding protein [Castellaniella sp.]|uniref:ABC transporter ATP-binding protein n=1 Tax=Castellaniella sp. TaxID=1955812 RepID=UPI00355CD73D